MSHGGHCPLRQGPAKGCSQGVTPNHTRVVLREDAKTADTKPYQIACGDSTLPHQNQDPNKQYFDQSWRNPRRFL